MILILTQLLDLVSVSIRKRYFSYVCVGHSDPPSYKAKPWSRTLASENDALSNFSDSTVSHATQSLPGASILMTAPGKLQNICITPFDVIYWVLKNVGTLLNHVCSLCEQVWVLRGVSQILCFHWMCHYSKTQSCSKSQMTVCYFILTKW